VTDADKALVDSVFHDRCGHSHMQPPAGALEQVQRQVQTLVSANYIPPLQWGVVGGIAGNGTPVTQYPLDPEFAICVVFEIYLQRGSFDLSARPAIAFLKNTALRIKQVAKYHGDWPHETEAVDAAMTEALKRWVAREWVRITGRSKVYNRTHYAKQQTERMRRQRDAAAEAEAEAAAAARLRALRAITRERRARDVPSLRATVTLSMIWH
jgi:hypothetical protein